MTRFGVDPLDPGLQSRFFIGLWNRAGGDPIEFGLGLLQAGD